MAEPIALSFAGEGRVVMLRPATVRRAYFEFVQANDLMARQVYRMNARTSRSGLTVLDRLHRRPSSWYYRGKRYAFHAQYDYDLTPPEIARIEHVMNRMLLHDGAVLAHGESQFRFGTVVRDGFRRRTERIQYVIRYGMFFEVEPLKRETLLQGSVRDVIVEGHDRCVAILRYDGPEKDASGTRLELRFRRRFDFRQSMAFPLSDFRPRRLFSIRRVEPCEGFAIRERVPLADGRPRRQRRAGKRR